MAATVEGRRLTEEHRRAQQALSAALLRELVTLWRGFGTGDVDGFWPAIRTALLTLIPARRRISAGLASAYYRDFRAAEGIPGLAPVRLAVPPEPALVEATVDIAGPVSFKQSISRGNSLDRARSRALVTESGAVSKLVLGGGRDTVERSMLTDEKALGWARVTDGDPCAWCAMLASRGGVFKSAQTAGDPRTGAMPWHPHDGCTAEPVFSRNAPLPGRGQEFQDLWYSATEGEFGAAKLNAFRRAYEAQQTGASVISLT